MEPLVQLTDEWRARVDRWLEDRDPPENTRQWLAKAIGADPSTVMDLLRPREMGGLQTSRLPHRIVRLSGLPYPVRKQESEQNELLMQRIGKMNARQKAIMERITAEPEILDKFDALLETLSRRGSES